MNTYTYYVGSTDWYDAHTGTRHADAFPSLQFYRENVTSQNVFGIWEGTQEATLVLSVDLDSDEVAQRIAYAIATLTGNDAVLVTRDALPVQDDFTMSSARAYRVTREIRNSGNRTLYPGMSANGWALVPDMRGSYVAFLVWRDAHVSAIPA